jgi:hypothetical protein
MTSMIEPPTRSSTRVNPGEDRFSRFLVALIIALIFFASPCDMDLSADDRVNLGFYPVVYGLENELVLLSVQLFSGKDKDRDVKGEIGPGSIGLDLGDSAVVKPTVAVDVERLVFQDVQGAVAVQVHSVGCRQGRQFIAGQVSDEVDLLLRQERGGGDPFGPQVV